MKRLLKAADAPRRTIAAPLLSCIALLLTLACAAAPGRAQDIVNNGGFESPVLTGTTLLLPQGQTLGGWVVATGSVTLLRNDAWQPQEGNQSLQLSGPDPATSAGTIHQDLQTVPGQMYRLRFYGSSPASGSQQTQAVNVLWDGQSLGHQRFEGSGPTPANAAWSHREYFVTARGTVTRLTFQGVSGPGLAAAIDNVSVTATAPWSAPSLSVGADNRTRLLWRHTSGFLSFWTLTANGRPEAIEEYGPFPPFMPSFVATGTDNRSRLLWTSPNNVASLWSLSPFGLWESFTEYGPLPGWSPAALAIGGDNMTRLLWAHLNGTVSLHLLASNGVFQRFVEFGPFPGWKATAMGTGGDNRTRLMWVNGETGVASVHTLAPNGDWEKFIEYGPFPGWMPELMAVGRSDNRTRLVWRHTNGTISFWTLTPDGVQEGFQEFGPFPGWTATAIAVGADNRTRLLWTHDTGAVSLWLISPDGRQQERYVQFGPFF